MKTTVFMASLLALAVLAPAANALTVQNNDSKAYTLKWEPTGGKASDLKLLASGKADIDCATGGTLMLGAEKADCTNKTLTLSIKDGKFAS
jgi:hypothetical protein